MSSVNSCLPISAIALARTRTDEWPSNRSVVKNGVSKKLTHLCAGSGAGTSKLQKARELGILVVNTDWLRRTLEEGGIDVGPGNGGFELSMGDVEI